MFGFLSFRARLAPMILMGALVLLMTGCATKTFQTAEPTVHPEVTADSDQKKEGGLDSLTHEELLEKGFLYLRQGNASLARLHFALDLKKNSPSAPAYTGLGRVFTCEKKYRSAEKAFDQALKIDPRYRPALLGSGQSLRAQAKYAEAIKVLTQAMDNYPGDPVAMTETAMTYDSWGQEEKAEPLYLEVTVLAPEDASARNNLGFNYLLQGKYRQAVQELEQALSLDPESSRIRNNLATAYALNNQEEQAFQLFAKSIGEAGAYNDLGYFYMIRGKWVQADRAFKQALEVHPVFYAKAKENLDHLQRLREGER